MKKFVIISLICIMCLLLLIISICGNKKDFDKDEVKIFLWDKYSEEYSDELQDILTKQYSIIELRDFFETEDINQIHFSETPKKLKFDDVNKQFPVEVIRPGEYTVYSVREGGYYYVFWGVYYTSEDMSSTEISDVQLVAYINSTKDLSDFNSLKIGVSTAKDVHNIDPYFELDFLKSRGTFSYSFLDSETLLEIEYDKSDIVSSYDDLIVKEINVIPRGYYTSNYSVIYPKDLPEFKKGTQGDG